MKKEWIKFLNKIKNIENLTRNLIKDDKDKNWRKYRWEKELRESKLVDYSVIVTPFEFFILKYYFSILEEKSKFEIKNIFNKGKIKGGKK